MDNQQQNNYKSQTAELLLKLKAIKLNPSDPFIWASGWKSPIYCDNRILLSDPGSRNTIANYFTEIVNHKYDGVEVIAGVATGAIGIETLLPLALEMYHNESLPLNKIIETLTINPAKILKINKGSLTKGSDGDICVLDLDAPWVVKAEKLKSKSKNTAIEGRKLQGKILMTFLNGELVFNQ